MLCVVVEQGALTSARTPSNKHKVAATVVFADELVSRLDAVVSLEQGPFRIATGKRELHKNTAIAVRVVENAHYGPK